MRYISANELDFYYNKEGVKIIDVRSESEYKKAHFQGAVNIPYREFEMKVNKMELEEFDKNKTYIIYCDRGSMSLSICKKLSYMGYKTVTVVGGIRQYRGNHLTR